MTEVTNGNFDKGMTVQKMEMPTLKVGDLLKIETKSGTEIVKVYKQHPKGGDIIIDTVRLNYHEVDQSNFKELKNKYANELGSHGGSLTKDLAKKMYSEIVPDMTPSTFARLFDTHYGYSGYMCEAVEKWVS